MKKYKAVVIGCGRIGAEEWRYKNNIKPVTHAAAYFMHPKIELAALCDTDSKKLKKANKLFEGVALYESAAKMLKENNPDIVSVATHADTHFKFAKMAAESGAKAIICEKPMANSIKKAELLIKICKQKKCLLFINHSRHFDPLIKKWQEKVQNGLLGKILQVNCLYYNGMFNNGTHIIDLLRWFLGEVKEVSGVLNMTTSNPKKGENIDAIIIFQNGSRAVLQSVTEEKKLTEWIFYGEKGDVALKKLGIEVCYKNVKFGTKRSLALPMVSHVTSCLEDKEKPQSTGQDGLEVLKILFAIKKSAQNNGKITSL